MAANQVSEKQVVVVGAGPAGLATAIACASRGLSVLVLERRPAMPIDKACGEGLMPDAVQRLKSLGVEVTGRPLQGIRYSDGRSEVFGRFLDENGGDSTRLGLGVRRLELSKKLRQRAEKLGVTVQENTRAKLERVSQVREFEGGPDTENERSFRVRCGDKVLRPLLIVGADGLNSSVRTEAGMHAGLAASADSGSGAQRLGVRRHFEVAAGERTSNEVEVLWGNGVEAYVTPVTERLFGVALLFCKEALLSESGNNNQGNENRSGADSEGSVFERLLARFPALKARVASCTPATRVMGAGPLRQTVSRHSTGNVVLVGDAGGYVDAITGEGLAIAFAEAEMLSGLLAEALEGSTSANRELQMKKALHSFDRAARRSRRVPELVTEGALALSRRPRLRRRFLRALEAQPGLFDRVLALHTRVLPDRAIVPIGARLAWGIVKAPAASIATKSAKPFDAQTSGSPEPKEREEAP